MDVGFRSVGTIFLSLISLAACSPKTTTSVFNEADYGRKAACAGRTLQNRYIVQWEDGRFTVETAPNVERFKKDFLEPNLENVRKVEYDRVVQFERNTDIVKLNDLDPADYWGQDMVEVSDVWGQGIFGQNVKVGVIDSFVDTTHPQLWSNIAYNTEEIPGNGKDDDNNGYIDDYAGFTFISKPGNGTTVSDHGTHVAGIIAADSTKGYVKGMAPQAKIVPAPFIDGENGGSIGDAILALQYVSTRGVKIINASWGGASCSESQSLQNAFAELNNKGILIVVAAGNEGRDLDYSPDYPAAFNMPNQITVAAATPSDLMIHWSNSGFNLVHLAAPGVDILSTITNKRMGYMSGTSMAAPFVTGAAALLWSDRPKATAIDIKTALLRSVDVDPARQYKVQTLGRMNVRKALEELRKLVP